MRSPGRSSWAGGLTVAGVAVPAIALAILVGRYARNIPWWDQWGIVPFMAEATQGRFPPRLLWYEVNEHRIPAALLLQGAVAWVTRWDIRFDAWTNVALGVGSALALAALARRTIAPGAVPVVATSAALLALSPVAGNSWTAGWITPAFLATFAAALAAFLLAGAVASWPRVTAVLVTAITGALAFGSGMALLLVVPLGLAAQPGALRPRLVRALVAAAVGFVVIRLYFIGWYPRIGFPPPVFHPDRLDQYVAYALAFLGGPVSERSLVTARVWGAILMATLVVASGWLVVCRRDAAGRLVPWWFLALFGIVNGLVTAYGRLDNGANTALLVRYVPTAGLFVAAVVAAAAMALADIRERSRAAWIALIAVAVLAYGYAGHSYARVARSGIHEMASLALRLDRTLACVSSCSAACLRTVCWSGELASDSCRVMQRLTIGPFRDGA